MGEVKIIIPDDLKVVEQHLIDIKCCVTELELSRLSKTDLERMKSTLKAGFTLSETATDRMVAIAKEELDKKEEECLSKLTTLCTKKPVNEELTMDELKRLYIEKGKTAREIADMYGMKTQQVSGIIASKKIKKKQSTPS